MAKQAIAELKNPSIGIIVFPLSKAGESPLSNLIDIVSSLADDIYVITGNVESITFKGSPRRANIHAYSVEHHGGANQFTRTVKYTWTQLKICHQLAKAAKNAKIWLFFLGGENLLLPMLTAKLLGRRVILVLGGFSAEIAEARKDPFSAPLKWIYGINCHLADRIILYTQTLILQHNLEKYRGRIFIAHEHFIDFAKFKVGKPLQRRDSVVGYIGRLSQEKGILNFMEAAVKVLEKEANVKVVIGGDGQLRTRVEQYLSEHKLNNMIKFVGWIPHDELPKYLNELKLLVLPSYTEGLPNIMLEAMACGTPVLATPVGAIPDVIKDGDTGFLLKDNSPETIAQGVVRALNYPSLAQIAKNARALVEREFTFEKAVERWGILNELRSKR